MTSRKGPLDYLRDHVTGSPLSREVAARGITLPSRRETLARAEYAYVMEARRLGASWARIAGALGRSRQAVWARYHADDARFDHANACTMETGGTFAYINPPPGAGRSDPLGYVLRLLASFAKDEAESERQLVREAREQGASWAAIAGALGEKPQSVWERHRWPRLTT